MPNHSQQPTQFTPGEYRPFIEDNPAANSPEMGSIIGEYDKAPLYVETVYKTMVDPRPTSKDYIKQAASPEAIDQAFEANTLLSYARNLDFMRKEHIKSGELQLASPDTPIFNELATKMFGEKIKSGLIDPLFAVYRPVEHKDLIDQESTIGGTVFGVAQKNETIKFYNLDATNWYFYQKKIVDQSAKPSSSTIHYIVYPKAVYKYQPNSEVLYQLLEREELDSLMLASRMYYERVTKQIYGRDHQTGKKLQ